MNTDYWNKYYYEHKERYDFASKFCRGKSVLDAACGTGYGSEILAEKGAIDVTGVDISSEAIDEAKKYYQHPKLQFIELDVLNLDSLGKKFDMVVSFETIEHLAKPDKFLKQVHLILKPEGTFICSSPNRNYSSRNQTENPYHLSEMTYKEFLTCFEQYFVIDKQYHQSPSPQYARMREFAHLIRQQDKYLQYSWMLRLENELRRLFGRQYLQPTNKLDELMRIRLGDYPIAELCEKPHSQHLAFIFVGFPMIS